MWWGLRVNNRIRVCSERLAARHIHRRKCKHRDVANVIVGVVARVVDGIRHAEELRAIMVLAAGNVKVVAEYGEAIPAIRHVVY